MFFLLNTNKPTSHMNYTATYLIIIMLTLLAIISFSMIFKTKYKLWFFILGIIFTLIDLFFIAFYFFDITWFDNIIPMLFPN